MDFPRVLNSIKVHPFRSATERSLTKEVFAGDEQDSKHRVHGYFRPVNDTYISGLGWAGQ